MNYCLGFIFDKNRSINLMVQKDRPKWQEGLLNGIGGKVEEGEERIDAMVRECYEETGLDIPESDWIYGGVLKGHGWECNIYYTTHEDIFQARTMETEEIVQRSTRDLILGRFETVSHAPALVQLCNMQRNGLNNMKFTLDYNEDDRADEG